MLRARYITKFGKRAREQATWVKEVARPYLDKTYGHVCMVNDCGVTDPLDVDHIKSKGSRPDLKQSLDNVQYLCRPHHRMKTDGKN